MQVAVVIEDPPPHTDRAGAVRLRRFATAFAERGHDVRVYCSGWWEGYSRTVAVDGVTFEAVTVSPAVTSFLARVPGLLARDRPDAILVSPSPPSAVVAAAAGGAVARAPVICDWFGDEPGHDSDRWRGVAARRSTLVVTPSNLLRTEVRELGVPESRTAVVPQSIDFPLVESTPPRDRPSDAEVEAVYARRLDADANLESFLLALAELRGRGDWSATVVGDGPERASYEAQARDLQLGDRVAFVGESDRAERIGIYRAADVFVQTARRERFAEEFLWALAAGCVGVVEYQDASSAHELAERRDRCVRATDAEELDDAIERAWEMPFRDLEEDFRAYDHAAVAGEYLSLFRDRGVDAR